MFTTVFLQFITKYLDLIFDATYQGISMSIHKTYYGKFNFLYAFDFAHGDHLSYKLRFENKTTLHDIKELGSFPNAIHAH